jgi:hypothetical protein
VNPLDLRQPAGPATGTIPHEAESLDLVHGGEGGPGIKDTWSKNG